jgi:hypothetical protein
MFPAVVFVLMVLAPTTKTGLEWHPYTAAPSKELCETRLPHTWKTGQARRRLSGRVLPIRDFSSAEDVLRAYSSSPDIPWLTSQ